MIKKMILKQCSNCNTKKVELFYSKSKDDYVCMPCIEVLTTKTTKGDLK